jgi:SAM-dependent methyltransferase
VSLGDHDAVLALGELLRDAGYRFVTVSPETHRRVLTRRPRMAESLADVFGWNLPFDAGTVTPEMMRLLRRADLAQSAARGFTSRVRFSSLEGGLYAHSAFPTDAVDSVFFGPDTYRFCRAIQRVVREPRVVVDIGCGAGAGGIVAAPRAGKVILADINDEALAVAHVNARLNSVSNVEIVKSDVLAGVHEEPDLIVANPPYLVDSLLRAYRHGGGEYGEGLAIRIVEESLERLRRGGKLLLYTGAAIVDGDDRLLRALRPALEAADVRFRYEEVDPDVFGQELSLAPYAAVDRIAAVTLEVEAVR